MQNKVSRGKMIKAVIIDCDQVLTANTKQNICRELAAQNEKDIDEIYPVMRKLWRTYRRQEITEDQFIEQFINEAGLNGTSVEEIKKMRKLFQIVHPEVKQWLQAHHSNMLLFIASNYGKEWSQYLRKEHNLDDLFTGYFWSWEMKTEKPSKTFFEKIIAKLAEHNIKPEEAVFIDDYEENTKAATENGFNIITFQDIEQLEKAYQKLLVETA